MGLLRDRMPKLLALLALIVITPLPVLVNHFQVATFDPDIWWHVRVGQVILLDHAVPHTGIFSQHALEHTWVAYSWGFEVVSAVLMRVFGLAFIPIMLGFLRALIPFAAFVMLYRVGRRFWVAWILATLVAMGIHLVMVARPVLFTILFFIIEIGLIYEARARRSLRPLYWLPLLFCAWANMHIQFVYGLAVLGLFVVCESISSRIRSGSGEPPLTAQRSRLALVLGASVIATLLNPYGWQLYAVILRYAGNTAQYAQIQELAAMGFRNLAHYIVLLLVMSACYVLGKKHGLFNALLLLIAGLVAFRSARDVWFVCIPAAFIIAEHARDNAVESVLRRSELVQFAGTFIVGFALVFGFMRSEGLDPQSIVGSIDKFYPIAATQYVSDHRPSGPMYNSFDWGGFLIFNLREYPVSIDGRNDFYGPAAFDRVQKTMNGVDWQSDPDLAKAGFVLMERGQPLARILAADPNFKLAYSDNLAVVFVRNR